MRLDRFLSKTLNLSRNDVKKIIRTGQVCINEIVIKTDGFHVNTALDVVTLNGNVLEYVEFHYYIINKPAGYVCANEDNLHPTIIDYAPAFSTLKVHTVGRLDKDTTGILLLTNDGKLTHRLIAPKTATAKIYEVTVDEKIPPSLVTTFAEGFMINDEYKTMPSTLQITSETTAKVTLIEGKYHQVKRMFSTFGLTVTKLHRSSFSGITAPDLSLGEWRVLSKDELDLIFTV